FFSSRRRHTRSDRDWSSDVCSSDLLFRSQPPFAPYPNQRIGPALDVSSGGSIDWAGMSASGKYAVVSYNGDYPRVFDVNTSTLALTPHPMSTSSYRCHGSASDGFIYALGHAD